jgi:hypothetical protein
VPANAMACETSFFKRRHINWEIGGDGAVWFSVKPR